LLLPVKLAATNTIKIDLGGKMYTVSVRRDFIAQHFLIGGDWGDENNLHSHHYVLELELSGDRLDQHNYLVDIVEIERQLDAQVSNYHDQTLNEQPEFAHQNPSLELFSRLLCEALSQAIPAPNIKRVTVRLWENATAWAAFSLDR
jgi:6-pyruvoyltetrahydropterin/6-carboxytetrahydropterin synthase